MAHRFAIKRRKNLLACEQSYAMSDNQKGIDPSISDLTVTGYIEYKDTTSWKDAYDDLLGILANRENMLNQEERKQNRIEKAKHNRSSRRR